MPVLSVVAGRVYDRMAALVSWTNRMHSLEGFLGTLDHAIKSSIWGGDAQGVRKNTALQIAHVRVLITHQNKSITNKLMWQKGS